MYCSHNLILTLIGALVVSHAMLRRLTSRRCIIIIYYNHSATGSDLQCLRTRSRSASLTPPTDLSPPRVDIATCCDNVQLPIVVQNIDMAAFCHDTLQSKLLTNAANTPNCMFDAEARRVLDLNTDTVSTIAVVCMRKFVYVVDSSFKGSGSFKTSKMFHPTCILFLVCQQDCSFLVFDWSSRVAPCPSQIPDHMEHGFGVVSLFNCFFWLSTFCFNHALLSVVQLLFICRSNSLYPSVACFFFVRVFACSCFAAFR